jgi:F-type H+/Na+-transporting ATPase subunit alpha
VADVRRFEKEFLEHLRLQNKGILDDIAQTKQLSDETAASLVRAITSFKKNFETSEGKSLAGNEQADDLDESTMSNEKVRKHVPPAEKK